uniref:Acetyl-coenzyme A carboxylase carboxyl transferase subunit beta, chloroplastic n=1 Tax=Passiflora incarnata TaxID=159425 RepID=A0A8E7MG37_PASIN|nr:acetyl-CoA carboxylase carboxyltransferase beta subunit [Passiflora incarnata]
MANLNNKRLWTLCCSNRDPDFLENENKKDSETENENKKDSETENPASEITNDPFFLSALDSCFDRYFNYGYRKMVIDKLIDSIIDDFLDDLIRSATDIPSSSANKKNEEPNTNENSDAHNGENEEPSTNDSSDNHNGEREEPSTNENSDTHNDENEEPSTSGNSDESQRENGRPSPNTNENADINGRHKDDGFSIDAYYNTNGSASGSARRPSPNTNENADINGRYKDDGLSIDAYYNTNGKPNDSPLRIWVWSSLDANYDDRPNIPKVNGIRNRFLDLDNVGLFVNENSDDHNGENEEPSTNDSSDNHNGESEEPSTNENSDAHKGENEDPSTNERKTIDYGAFWVQCETCYGINYKRLFFQSRLNICEHCGCHLRLDSPERIELSIDPGTWDPMDEAGKEDAIDPGTRDPMDEAGKEDEYMSVLDPIEWDWDSESEDDENEEDSEDEWDLDSDLYSYSDPDPNTDPEEESEEESESEEEKSKKEDPEESEKEESKKEESDPEEEDPEEEDPEESDPDEEDPEESDPDESDPEEEDPEKEDPDEEEWEEEEWEESESDTDEEEWDPWGKGDPWANGEWNPRDPEQQEQKKKKKDEEEDWSWLEIEKEEVEVEDKPYLERIFACQDETELSEAVQTGIGQINGIPVAIGVMDFRFIGGSMGCVVGEKITRLIEYATNQILPLILVCASGGARMYEGSLSLMQMAKISAAIYSYKKNKKSFYISILTTPTTGGVTASFGMLGDIIISEPDAYIAFAGKRVIEQTLNIEVPEGSQTAEVLFENGLLDPIVPRNPLKGVLDELLQLHNFCPLNKKE